jgi:hypothetical protein
LAAHEGPKAPTTAVGAASPNACSVPVHAQRRIASPQWAADHLPPRIFSSLTYLNGIVQETLCLYTPGVISARNFAALRPWPALTVEIGSIK